jgi:hypothetical protein
MEVEGSPFYFWSYLLYRQSAHLASAELNAKVYRMAKETELEGRNEKALQGGLIASLG